MASDKFKLVDIALDSYDDIFSDFDISDYSKRVLSDDFLKEIQKRYYENKEGGIEVRFFLPKKERSEKIERMIRQRLKREFRKMMEEIDKEINEKKKKGLFFVLVGFLLLIVSVYSEKFIHSEDILNIIHILFTPLGWFGMWEGTGMIVQIPGELIEKKKMYKKFMNARYLFLDEESLR